MPENQHDANIETMHQAVEADTRNLEVAVQNSSINKQPSTPRIEKIVRL